MTDLETHASFAQRRLVLSAAAAASFSLALPPAMAQVSDINNAINKAGRLRALSQRLTKSYVLIGSGVEVEDARRWLYDTIATFDRFLVELRAFASTAQVRETYNALDRLWQQAKTVALAAQPNKVDAAALLALDAKLLQTAQQGTLQFQQLSGRASAELVNVAGRQRMLSQRLAKFHFCSRWGVADREAGAEITRAREEFLAAMKLLETRAGSSVQKSALQSAQLQWVFFDTALSSGSGPSGSNLKTSLAQASELILRTFDDVTLAFEKTSA